MDYEYKRDLNRSYLILSEDSPEENEFQKNMLLKNRIFGLLPCFLRYKDGRQKYYYEISSKQPMEQLFEVKGISYEELKQLFIQLQLIVKELGNYLLDSNKLVLVMRYIYWDLGNGRIYFVYYPNAKGNLKENIIRFAEEIIEKTDHKDEKAVDAAYRFYQLAGEDNFSLQKWAEALEGGTVKPEDCTQKDTESGAESRVKEKEDLCNHCEDIPAERMSDPEGKGKREGVKKIILISAAAVAAAAAGIKYTMDTYVLSAAETAGGAAVLTAAVLGFYYVWKKRNKKEEPVTEEGREDEELCGSLPCEPANDSDSGTDGETVFLGMSEWEQERRLEGKIKGRELEIQLDAFPFVIGKLAERVSYVLADTSVSRLHAEFTEESGRLYLRDLNSRNGTCKNGVRLEGDEKVEVRPGDEIRIGRLLFTYR